MKNKIFKADNNYGGVLSATLSAAEVISASLTPVPTEAPGVIVLKAGEAQEEHVYYKEKDAGAGTISGLIRDYTNLNGGVGFEHINTTPFEVMQASEYINNLVDALSEGYVDEQQTLAYVSTTSFTVKTNKTAIYTKGRILRFSQDSTKIAKVVSSSYSVGTGLTTIVVSNVYANVPDPVTYVEISLQPKGATALQDVYYAEDAEASDAYAVAINSMVTALFTGLTIIFKANTANTGACTLNVNAIGAIAIKKAHDQDLADGDIEAGQLVIAVFDGTLFQMISPVAAATAIPVKATAAEINTGTDDAKFITALGLRGSALLNLPSGQLINGKIVPSVASNNLTVAIKGMDGNDPSATNPVFVRIGDTIKVLTAALSVTKNAGTNWFASGSAGLATKEVDYFVYLGYNATDGITVGFSRIPWGYIYSEFSATSTAETYCAISTITNAAAGDNYVNVGRFAATLSAGAGYTWTVPTFTAVNLIQRSIFTTRALDFLPTATPAASMTYTGVSSTSKYIINNTGLHWHFQINGTVGGTPSSYIETTLPFTPLPDQYNMGGGAMYGNGVNMQSAYWSNYSSKTSFRWSKYNNANFDAGASQAIHASIFYTLR